jgi:NADH-quinone oxidoreductase subunit G/NADP-reducing hydrogenase subunit HndD
VIEITVNDRTLEAQEGEMLLDVLRRSGISVPTLCHVDGLFPSGACRMCAVEVEGQRSLVPSCAFPVQKGMTVRTHSERAIRSRKTIVELLLADHPDDCLYCVRNQNCQLQDLAEELGVRQRRYQGVKSQYKLDVSSPSITRDPAKCILCGKCVRICEEVQGVSAIDFVGRGSSARIAPAFEEGINVSSCINCGQCIAVCPTGALRETSAIKEVMDALADPELTVVVQHAPAVSVSIGEFFDIKGGGDVMGAMTTALRRLGFDAVFDTAFSADLTVMEEGSELVERIRTGGALPMFTSCSPGWVKFLEQFYPEFLPNVSTCKSPQQMLGALLKSYWADQRGADPGKIFSVSVMPCTAKKFEAGRAEMGRGGLADIDAVLTTRELARVIRMRGLDLADLPPSETDTPFGERSGAGKIFGASGGVMEAAVRTAYHLLTGGELGDLNVKPVRGLSGVKQARVDIDGTEIGVAVASGLGNARKLLEEIRAGREDLHFVEVMTCPGGCIAGGGQPIPTDPEAVRARMQALYRIDRDETLRTAHANPSIRKIYADFLGEPLGPKSHELLHTHYAERATVT